MSKYRDDISRAAQFKALSNPHRLALFKRLMSCCAPGTLCSADEATRYCVGELGEGLDIAPSTVSHHLKELSQAGLIQMERQGKTIHCWVEPVILTELAHFFTYSENL
jgi:DNA-binding transcriptional ArsR family regulator